MSFKVFKTSQPILLQTRLTEFLTKTSGKGVMTDRIQIFLEILEKNYLSLTNLEGSSSSQNFLTQTKQTAINYLHQLSLFISKIEVSELNSFNIAFNWTDNLSQTTKTSNNIWFEYYSILYNIGIIYYTIATSYLKNNLLSLSPEESKLVRMYYCNALFYFDKIQKEIGSNLTEEEKGLDLSEEGLNYMRNVCIMGGYIALMNFSYCKYKQNVTLINDYEDIAKFNIENNTKQRLTFLNEIIVYAEIIIKYLNSINNVDKKLIMYYEFQRDFCKAYIEYFQYEINYLKHQYEGGKLGRAITYMKRYLEMISELEKSLPMLGNLVPSAKMSIEKEENESKLAEMIKANNVLRTTTAVQPNQIDRAELKLKSIDPEDKHNLTSVSEKDLISIISPELRSKVALVLQEIGKHLATQYKLYPTNESIQSKLNSIKYPLSIAAKLKQLDNNEYIKSNELIWEKIKYIQQLGCCKGVSELISILLNKNRELKDLLLEVIMLLNQEKTNDFNYRQQFGMNWNLKPSSADNYIKYTEERVEKLNNFNIRCTEFESEFYEQAISLNKLNTPIQDIQSHIPGYSKVSSMSLNENENKIMELLRTIDNLKGKIQDAKTKVQNELKDPNVIISGYSSIRNGLLKEVDFIAQQKERATQLVNQYLHPIAMEIKDKLNALISQCSSVCSSESEINKQKQIQKDNSDYIQFYQKNVDVYFSFLLKAHNGYTSIINVANKLHKGLNSLYSYLFIRENETNKLLQYLLKMDYPPQEAVQKKMLEQVFPLQKYKDMVNDLAKLKIDVSVFASKIGELNI